MWSFLWHFMYNNKDKLLKEEIYSNGNVKHILVFLFKYLFHILLCCTSGYKHKAYILSQIATFVTVVYSVCIVWWEEWHTDGKTAGLK